MKDGRRDKSERRVKGREADKGGESGESKGAQEGDTKEGKVKEISKAVTKGERRRMRE